MPISDSLVEQAMAGMPGTEPVETRAPPSQTTTLATTASSNTSTDAEPDWTTDQICIPAITSPSNGDDCWLAEQKQMKRCHDLRMRFENHLNQNGCPSRVIPLYDGSTNQSQYHGYGYCPSGTNPCSSVPSQPGGGGCSSCRS